MPVFALTLDKNGLTSAYGEPMDGPGEITAMVEPLAVVPRASPVADALETLPASVTFPVRFSSRPGKQVREFDGFAYLIRTEWKRSHTHHSNYWEAYFVIYNDPVVALPGNSYIFPPK